MAPKILVGSPAASARPGATLPCWTNGPPVLRPPHQTQVHSRGKSIGKDVDFEKVARRTPGFTGADLANLMNEAAILAARRNLKEISKVRFGAPTSGSAAAGLVFPERGRAAAGLVFPERERAAGWSIGSLLDAARHHSHSDLHLLHSLLSLLNLLRAPRALAPKKRDPMAGFPTWKVHLLQDEIADALERIIAGPEKKGAVISDKKKRLVAYHEAGHALVSSPCWCRFMLKSTNPPPA